MIQMADGSLREIRDVNVGDWVMVLTESSYKLEPKKIAAKTYNGEKEVFRVKTRKRELVGTGNHLLLVDNAWRYIDNIQPNSLLGVVKRTPFGTVDFPNYMIDLLAIWLAEGTKYRISNGSSEILEVFRQALKELDPNLELVQAKGRVYDWDVTDPTTRKIRDGVVRNKWRQVLESYGLWDKRSKTKFIPDIIFCLPKPKLSRFLNRFMGCDGCITKKSKKTYAIETGLANKHMVIQLSHLFLKFGIHGQIYYKKHKKKGIDGKHFQSWNLLCSNAPQVKIFCLEINAISKEDKVAKVYDIIRNNGPSTNDYLPIDYYDFVSRMRELPERRIGRYGGYNAVVRRGLPEDVRAALNSWRKQTRTRTTPIRYEQLRHTVDGYYDKLVYNDVAWEPIISVEPCGVEETWCIEVEDSRNFVAEGSIYSQFNVLSQSYVR